MIRALLLSLVLLAATPNAFAQDTGFSYIAEELAPGVHVFRQREPFHVQPRGNVVMIEQRAGVVLVDSGGTPAGAEEVIALVRARTDKPVRALVITHWHGDHVMGAERLAREWPGLRIISTEATHEHLTSPRTNRFMTGDDEAANAELQRNIANAVQYFRSEAENAALSEAERRGFAAAAREVSDYAIHVAAARHALPTETFRESLTLDDPDRPVEVRFLGRANTDGDATVWLPRQNIIATGDIIVAPVPYAFGSYPNEWLDVLHRLRAEDATLIPGHGAPLRDDAYADQLIALIEAGRTQVNALVAEGLSDEAVRERVDLSAARAPFVGDDPWLTRWFDAYWTEPFVTSALKEARGVPIVQGE